MNSQISEKFISESSRKFTLVLCLYIVYNTSIMLSIFNVLYCHGLFEWTIYYNFVDLKNILPISVEFELYT